MSLLDTTDKVFWHDYVSFYEKFFLGKDFHKIAEIGVFKGNSIRWLLDRFPKSIIYGGDILPVQPEWPTNERFKFMQFDQGNLEYLRKFFSQDRFDLVIEDGSHDPVHQALALIEGVQRVTPGGLYILEDVHTSHPEYGGKISYGKNKGNSLTVLLALDHYKKIHHSINDEEISLISKNSIFDEKSVRLLADAISTVSLYRRTRLPDYCYRCGAVNYDFSNLVCRCGVEVFSSTDSMTFVISVK